MTHIDLLKEAVRSGTIASLVMMPFGILFKFLGLRVGHYGPKVAAVLFDASSPVALFVQHLVIGWLSAMPLIIFLAYSKVRTAPLFAGAIYGVLYYIAVNSLALPLVFDEPTPWQLGLPYIYPSLVVHIVFGAAVGFACRKAVRTNPESQSPVAPGQLG